MFERFGNTRLLLTIPGLAKMPEWFHPARQAAPRIPLVRSTGPVQLGTGQVDHFDTVHLRPAGSGTGRQTDRGYPVSAITQTVRQHLQRTLCSSDKVGSIMRVDKRNVHDSAHQRFDRLTVIALRFDIKQAAKSRGQVLNTYLIDLATG